MDSKPPLNAQDSQETLVSLLQLDPTPMDTDKDLPDLPDDTLESSTSTIRSTPTASSIGLSGSNHGAVYYLSRIQRYSSYVFTVFATIHMTNTALVPLIYRSVPYSEPFLLTAREIYQRPFTEPLLVGLPVVAHVASGLSLRLVRRSQNLKRYGGATPHLHGKARSTRDGASPRSPWPALSNISVAGYVFTAAYTAHVAMNRVLPLVVEGDSSNIGLEYVSHGFARHPVQAWASYLALLGVGVGHMVWGWAHWVGAAPPRGWRRTTVDKALRRRRRRAWWGIQGATAAVFAVWAAGLTVVATGGKTEGWLGGVYDAIYALAGQ